MNELLLTYRGTVYPWHCDHMGHMNVMWYTGKFDEASWHFLSHLGLTRSFLKEGNRVMAALQQNTTYKRELHAGDIISITSGILEIRAKTIRFVHQMRNDETGEIAAVSELTGIHMDAFTRKSCPLPDEVQKRGRALLVDSDYLDSASEFSSPAQSHKEVGVLADSICAAN
jgi:acyl-CoA thioester hydrolase